MSSWHDRNGYGYATDRMLDSLHKLGYQVRNNDPSADVQIWFDQPQHWKWNDSDQHRVGYHPWESTKLQRGWLSKMNECDEVWATSPFVAEVYKKCGVKPPIFVYEHGVDHETWSPVRRQVEDTMKFLHVGGEAVRKGLDITQKAFNLAFPNNEDVELIIKQNSPAWKIPSYGRKRVITELLSLTELVGLYREAHVFVYPSWGEGFGLTPLQAMASGMPTICTESWAPYADFIEMPVSSEKVPSPWPKIHPGKMFEPNLDDVVDWMRHCYQNYDEVSALAYRWAPYIHVRYDWDSLTKETFGALEDRIVKFP